MVGWLYIEGQVAAPIHVLDVDELTGVMDLEVAGKFIPDRAELRGEVVVEYYAWPTRRRVRCLDAERIGTQLMIEAVDVGRPLGQDDPAGALGPAEDWLIVDGEAWCRAEGFTVGTAFGATAGHCMMHVSREAWRDLRVGERAPLAAVGVAAVQVAERGEGTITPKLRATPQAGLLRPADVRIVRLRERVVIYMTPVATDWADDSTLVVARVDRVDGFGTKPANLAADRLSG